MPKRRPKKQNRKKRAVSRTKSPSKALPFSDNKDLARAFKFVSIFAVLFTASYIVLLPLGFLNWVAAASSQVVLSSFFGVASTIVNAIPFPLIKAPNITAEISDLCSMKVEMAVLFGIVFASHERTLRYRVKGFLAALALVFLFNPIRIATTIYFFNASNLPASSLFHDILFRASIILFIVTFYAVWYYWDRK